MSLWNTKFNPMLLKEINEPFDSKDYIFEIKFDGVRAILFLGPNYFKIMSRNNKDITYLFKELECLKKIVKENTILDGEIVVMEKNGPSFSKLQERINLKDKNKIKFQSKNNPVIFVAFDILYQNKDLINLSLLERKKYLDKLTENEYFIKSRVFYDGIKLFNSVKKNNLEGIVAKKIDSTYKINTRSDNWIKIKNIKEETFIIGGYEYKKNNNLSIMIGEYKNNNLYYVGNAVLTKNLELYKKVLNAKKQNFTPFINYKKENVIYIIPKLKCIINYSEKTKNNHLRHPVIKR